VLRAAVDRSPWVVAAAGAGAPRARPGSGRRDPRDWWRRVHVVRPARLRALARESAVRVVAPLAVVGAGAAARPAFRRDRELERASLARSFTGADDRRAARGVVHPAWPPARARELRRQSQFPSALLVARRAALLSARPGRRFLARSRSRLDRAGVRAVATREGSTGRASRLAGLPGRALGDNAPPLSRQPLLLHGLPALVAVRVGSRGIAA